MVDGIAQAAATGALKRGGLRLAHLSMAEKELPHIRGQGQKPGGPHARRVAAKRSYPTSEVRGSGQECQDVMVQEQLRGATPCLRSGAVAGRSYPAPPPPEARANGREEIPHA